MKIVTIIYSFFLLFFPLQLKANDTSATVAGGVIQYEKSDNISMDYEHLKISIDQIEVTYDFTNHSNKDITTQVAFPLPPSPLTPGDTSRVFPEWDEVYNLYSFGNEKTINDQADYRKSFIDFKRTVNNEEQGYLKIIRAIKDSGEDITDLLIKNNIPLSPTYLGGFMEAGLIDKQPNYAKKLTDLGLLNHNEQGLWQLYITYLWNQTFLANKTTRVTHSYTPHPGVYWMTSKPTNSLEDIKFYHRDILINEMEEEKKISDFCVNKEDKEKILAIFKKENIIAADALINGEDITYQVKEIRYILSTGANWKGPIKLFRLEIVVPTPTTIAVCCFEGHLTKTPNGTYVAEIENFTPQKDLKILFIKTL